MAVQTDNLRAVVLCERLVAATRARHAEWRRENQDFFVWQGTQASVSIGSRDKDGQPPYHLLIVNPDGETLDELTSQLVDDDRPAGWNEPLADLYRAARRSALHADDIIEALIDELP
jgi:ankyrin repeat protein